MAIKRDKVNRKTHYIRLPISMPAYVREGDEIELTNLVERNINPDIKDPMAGFGQPDGTNYGDAVFDPMAAGAEETVFDPNL